MFHFKDNKAFFKVRNKRLMALWLCLSLLVPVCAWGLHNSPFVTTEVVSVIQEKKVVSVNQEKVEEKVIQVIPPADMAEMKLKEFLARNNLQNIEDYVRWLKVNIGYRPDPGQDIWLNPFETLQRGYGDCEDFAFLNSAVLLSFGFQPRIFAYEQGANAHVFTLFKKGGTYHIIDNAEYFVTPVTSIKDIVQFLVAKHNSSYFLEINPSPRKITVIYSNSG